MKEIWEQATLGYNLPLTLLLGLILIFWMISLLGLGDVGLDAEVDLDVDASGAGESASALGFLLRIVNAQDIPLMLILSLLSMFMWSFALASNFHFNPDQKPWLALVFLLPNFILSVLLVKVITQPLRPMFRSITVDQEHHEPLIGSGGHVKSRVLDETFGQCEVARPNGAPALLNCRLSEGAEPLVRGKEILVIGYDEDSRKFIVKTNQT